MTNERTDTDYLQDILYAMQKVDEFTSGLTFEQFIEDEKTQYAVIRAIEVIGEATKNLSDSIKNNDPTIPWKNIAGMRDKLIHAYFGVDMEILWKAVTEEISLIEPKIRAILETCSK